MQTRLEHPAALYSARSRTWLAVLAALAVIATTVLLPRLERADAAATSVVAINVNGPALTYDGTSFVPDSAVPSFSFDGVRYCAPTPVTPVPAGTVGLSELLNCFIWKNGTPGVRLTVGGLTASDYDVYVWTFEDNFSTTFGLQINGTTVENIVSGATGAWAKRGPYRVVGANAVVIGSTGGDANISAIEIVSPDGSVGPLLQPSPPNPGGWSSDNFVDELVAGNINQALSGDWLPDGRMIALGKTGSVYLVNPTARTSTPFFTIPGVDSSGEHGALDVLVPPDFATSNVFYVYYSVKVAIGGVTKTRVQIVEYTFNASGATTLSSGRVLWTNDTSVGAYHIGGSVTVGPDDKLYLSVGDDFDSSNGQKLTTIWSKILRLNRDGTIPTDNPFYDAVGPNADEIWAYGVRNPFRTSWDYPTGRYLIGDVGGNVATTAYEEVNIGARGANFGWSVCEGPLTKAAGQNGPNCPSGVTAPIHYYSHDYQGGCCQNASITGGEVFRSSALPVFFDGAYIFADYADQKINWGTFGTNGALAATGLLKATPNRAPVWISQGPDGHIYYANFVYGGGGEIRRLRYTGPLDAPPTLGAVTASPTSGGAPLTVTFNAVASHPTGGSLTYRWDFDDGTTSTEASPTHVYTAVGLYRPTVTVSTATQSVTSDALSIQVGIPPTATITSPADNTQFNYGETLTVTGTASDDETLPADAMRWDVQLVHAAHTHPVATAFGNSVQIPVTSPDHAFASDTYYRVRLSVTDNDRLVSSSSIDLKPRVVATTLRSNLPGGATVAVQGIRQLLPFAYESVVGYPSELSMPETLCIAGNQWRMTAWSNGGAPTFTYVTPATAATLEANYTNTGPNAACPAAGVMRMSTSADRSASVVLQGASLAQGGSVALFFQENVPLRSVRFLLDGVERRTELAAPYDFDGGAVTSATLTPLASLALGTHTIRVEATTVAGAVEIIDTTFTVTSSTTTSSTTSTTASTTTTTASATTASTTSTTQPSGGVGAMRVSTAANRSGSVALQGASLAQGSSVVFFFQESAALRSVRFLLDGAVRRTELAAPYDFDGGAVTSAALTPLSGAAFGVGTHTIRAEVTTAAGAVQAIDTTFTVTAGGGSGTTSSTTSSTTSTTTTTTPPAGGGSLRVSTAADRSGSVAVQGWPGTGRSEAYIFLDTTQSFIRVVFTLNNAAVRTETLAPWDFGGGLLTVAFPYNIAGLPTGLHTVRAVATRADGTTQTFEATFTK